MRSKEKAQFQKALCDSLGIEIKPPTKAQKVFGFLRKAGGLTVKAGNLTVQVAKETDKIHSGASEPKRRRKAKRRNY